ncbi:hypothetical protein VSY18_29830 (plasmid) [Bacillus albus]|uniref:hypothetical protein n=1 Tax=Bacillus cereus group TaxID=86661 RepID=UPI002E2F1B07|nr:hypothetical protein [Bacillus albus]
MLNAIDFENGLKESGMDYVGFQEKVFHLNTLILRAYSRISDSKNQQDLEERLNKIKELEKERLEFLKKFKFV